MILCLYCPKLDETSLHYVNVKRTKLLTIILNKYEVIKNFHFQIFNQAMLLISAFLSENQNGNTFSKSTSIRKRVLPSL